MTLLIWLAASSLLWGAVLWISARILQRATNAPGATRQWIWRGVTALLLAPWIAAPFVVVFGLGLAPPEQTAVATEAVVQPAADTLTAMHALDTVGAQTAVVSDGGTMLSWLAARSLPELLLITLIAGWLVRFVLAQLALRSLLGIVNLSREAQAGVVKSFVQSWATRLKLRPAPRLRIVAEQHSPFSYGILRPTICLPEGMEGKLSRGSLDLVIGHESIHIARGDGWLRPVERVTADILWFNPFAWLIRRELDVARELAVDEAVLAMSNARVAYARTLRDVAGFAAGLAANAPAASMSLVGGRNLMLRVSRTLSQTGRKPARAAVLAACMLGLVGAPLAVAQVMMVAPAPPAPPQVPVAPPVPPVAPEAPPAGEYDSKSGEVRATFKAKVIGIKGDATAGYGVELLQTARNEENEVCYAQLDGLGELSVAKGDVVAEGGVVGKSRKSGKMRFAVSCSDDLDASGKPKASPPPVPPVAPPAPMSAPAPKLLAAPGPLSPLDQIAPPAPPAPPSRVSRAAPPAPPAPVTPMVAPTPPTPVTPATPATPMVPPPAPPSPPSWNDYQPAPPKPLKTGVVIEDKARVTSSYGVRVDPISRETSFHAGVDIGAPMGTPVHSPVAGKVVLANVKNDRGNVVDVQAVDGKLVSFAQLGTMSVKAGDTVSIGQVIGTVGSSGRSTGPHLHLEVTTDGQTQDPEKVGGLALVAEK